MHSISESIKYIILEEFIKKHSVIEDLPDRKTVLNIIQGSHNLNQSSHKGKINISRAQLKHNSPRGLYRAKGLNITNYHKIMNKYGLPGHESKSTSKNSFTNLIG